MRIGIVYLGRRGPGGEITLLLARQLSKSADVFCAISEGSDYVESFRACAFPVITAPTFTSRAAALTSYWNAKPARRLAQEIRRLEPDVLLYPMVHPWTPRLQRLLRPVPDIVVVHDPLPHPGFFHRLSSLWERRAARASTRCVVLGNVFVDTIAADGVSRDAIDVIPLPMLSHHDNGIQPDRTGSRPPAILFFGRITRYKGLEILLQAFAKLLKHHPEARLKIVGDGDLKPYRQQLDRLHNVDITNAWIDDSEVAACFHDASMTVLPYTSASQSGVIATAAVFGSPVIATRTGAIPEQIENGVTGILVEPGSVEQLEEAMRTLLDQPEYAKTLGANLAADAGKRLNWDIMGSRFLESCRKAISTSSQSKLHMQEL